MTVTRWEKASTFSQEVTLRGRESTGQPSFQGRPSETITYILGVKRYLIQQISVVFSAKHLVTFFHQLHPDFTLGETPFLDS